MFLRTDALHCGYLVHIMYLCFVFSFKNVELTCPNFVKDGRAAGMTYLTSFNY
jgi:hypothetical protein